jgi:hypothetical protein
MITLAWHFVIWENVESGLEYYDQALVIKKWEVPESLDVANTHNNMGTDLKNLAKWDKSMLHFKRVLDMHQRKKPDSLFVAQSYNNIGLLLLAGWFKVE